MLYCQTCQFLGCCRKPKCPIVTDLEIANERFIRCVRATALDQSIASRAWVETLYDWLRDYSGCFADTRGRLVELDMSHLEYPEGEEKDEAPYARWYHDFCNTPCPPNVTPFVRKEAWERVRIVATLLRATYPVRASTWGKVPANDNRPPKPSI